MTSKLLFDSCYLRLVDNRLSSQVAHQQDKIAISLARLYFSLPTKIPPELLANEISIIGIYDAINLRTKNATDY